MSEASTSYNSMPPTWCATRREAARAWARDAPSGPARTFVIELLSQLDAPAAPLVGGAETPIEEIEFLWIDCLPNEYDAILKAYDPLKQSHKWPMEKAYKGLLSRLKQELTAERQHREKAEAAVAILNQQLADAATGWRETMESAKTLEGLAGMQAAEIAALNKRNAMLADDNGSLEKEAASLRARLEEEKTAAAESEREKLEAYKELGVQDGVMQELRNENTRLLRNAGYGGVADQAPDEIHLCGDPAMGCDAWLCIARVQMENGVPTADWQMAMAAYRATDAVRYVKADPAPVQGEGEEGKEHPAELALAEIRDYLKDQSERRGHILDVDIPHLIDSVIGPEVSDSRWEQFRDEPGLDELPF